MTTRTTGRADTSEDDDTTTVTPRVAGHPVRRGGAAGHALVAEHRGKALREFGEVLEEA
jgi:hypothetical protein